MVLYGADIQWKSARWAEISDLKGAKRMKDAGVHLKQTAKQRQKKEKKERLTDG